MHRTTFALCAVLLLAGCARSFPGRLADLGVSAGSTGKVVLRGTEADVGADVQVVIVEQHLVQEIWDCLHQARPYGTWYASGYRVVELYGDPDAPPVVTLYVNESGATHTDKDGTRFRCPGLHELVMRELERAGQSGAAAPAAAGPRDGDMVLTGRCHCGAVAFRVTGVIVKCSYCDCRGCRKTTGTLQAPFVTMPRDRLAVTAGEPTVFTAENGRRCDAHGSWHFCAACGSPLWWQGNKGNEVDLFAGALDDPTVFVPPAK